MALGTWRSRYRQRYVDLIVTPKAREIFLKRSQIVREFRTSWKPTALMEVENSHNAASALRRRSHCRHFPPIAMPLT